MRTIIKPVLSPILRGVLEAAQPSRLFAAGEPGIWYDPSDLSTLFQDSAGTTPVTAVGQPVGRLLDKSKGLVLGSELETDTWSTPLSGVTYSDGTFTFDGVTSQANIVFSTNTPATPIVAGRTYRVSFTIFQNTTLPVGVDVGGALGDAQIAPGTYTRLITATSTTGPQVRFRTNSGPRTGSMGNISVRELPGNHATQTTAGKRPVLEVDANGCYYLKGDATAGRAMVTNTIAPGTNKVQVFAGIRKLSDAAQAVIAEYSATIASNNGSLLLSAPNSAAANYNFSSKGTTQVDNTVTTYAAARTDVLSGLADIAGDSNSIRVSGKQAALVSTDQGTGNYGNYPLYLFGRAGTSLYFDGRLYGLIVRFGHNLNAVTIMEMERYMAGKTGIAV